MPIDKNTFSAGLRRVLEDLKSIKSKLEYLQNEYTTEKNSDVLRQNISVVTAKIESSFGIIKNVIKLS
jgi:hypothetical protein